MAGIRCAVHHVLDFDRQAPRASAKRCARFWTWAMRARASGAGASGSSNGSAMTVKKPGWLAKSLIWTRLMPSRTT